MKLYHGIIYLLEQCVMHVDEYVTKKMHACVHQNICVENFANFTSYACAYSFKWLHCFRILSNSCRLRVMYP